jgi:hypothetical protein
MSDVPLYHRTELPPGFAGEAKPPYALADTSGQQRFGQTLFHFSGATFDKIVRTRAANEHAEFAGFAKTEIESVRTYVAGNPNLPFEEYEKRIGEAAKNIRTASGQATTGIGRDANTRWMDLYLPSATQTMITDAEAELSKQEFQRAEVQRKVYIAEGNLEGLLSHSQNMIDAGTYDAEYEKARLKLEQGIFEEQAVFALANKGEYEAAEEAIKQAEHLSPQDRDRLYGEIHSASTRVRIEANRQQVLIEDQTRKTATDLLVDDKLSIQWLRQNQGRMAEDDYERFNKYLLQRKVVERKEIETREILAARWGLISDITDDIDDIRMGKGDPIAIKMKIDELATLGRQGVSDAEQYRAKLSQALQDQETTDSPLKRPVVKSGFETLARLRNQYYFAPPEETTTDKDGNLVLNDKAILENELKSLAIRNDFENFIRQKPDASDDEIEKKILDMVRPYRKERALGFFSRAFRFRKKRWLFGLIKSEVEREFPYRGMEPEAIEPVEAVESRRPGESIREYLKRTGSE